MSAAHRAALVKGGATIAAVLVAGLVQTAASTLQSGAAAVPASQNVSSCTTEEVPNTYNPHMRATNVWEVDVDTGVVNAARDMFHRAGLVEEYLGLNGKTFKHSSLAPRTDDANRYFVVRAGGLDKGHPGGWSSNLAWVSADDVHTWESFNTLFHGLGLHDTFMPIVGSESNLTLYAGYYMVRTRGTKPNWHVDYAPEVGQRGLTIITPIDTFAVDPSNEDGQFQLLYKESDGDAPPRRYTYERGKAIVFGAGFEHTSEPGAAADLTAPHVYLCFCFGTDRQEHWPGIAKTLDGYQAKWLSMSNGEMVLSKLGVRMLEEANGTLAENAPSLAFDPELPKS